MWGRKKECIAGKEGEQGGRGLAPSGKIKMFVITEGQNEGKKGNNRVLEKKGKKLAHRREGAQTEENWLEKRFHLWRQRGKGEGCET